MPFIHLRSQLTTAATPHSHAEQPQQPTMHRHHHNAYTQQSSHALNTRPNHPSNHSSHHNPGQTPRTVQTDQYPTPSAPKTANPPDTRTRIQNAPNPIHLSKTNGPSRSHETNLSPHDIQRYRIPSQPHRSSQYPYPIQNRPQNQNGGERIRTDDPLLAKQVLSQLSYTPRSPLAIQPTHAACTHKLTPRYGPGRT